MNDACITVSNRLPVHSSGEYTKNWKNNLINQKTPSPNEMVLPKSVCVSAFAEVKQSTPIKNTVNPMKKV